jgi:hypothetical protein
VEWNFVYKLVTTHYKEEKMKVQLIIIGFIFVYSSIVGQNKKDCKQILKKEFSLIDFQENVDEFAFNFQTLVYCEFDSIDYQIFMGPQGNMTLIAQTIFALYNKPSDNKKYTFKDLRDLILEFKQQKEYSQVREIVEAQNEIKQKKASIQNWDIDKQLLLRMGLTENQIVDIYAILTMNENKHYSEIFTIYSDTLTAQKERQRIEKENKDAELKKKNPEIEEWITGLFAYKDYKLGLSRSKELNKPTLLYFNGYGCINAREIERKILLDSDIQDYINNNLILVSLIVDERTKLEEDEIYYSDILKKNITFRGQISAELEIKLYDSNSQPLFILLDSNGKEISRIGYTKDFEEFNTFLKKIEK